MSRAGRIYSSAIGMNNNAILPWVSLVMASLLLSDKHMKSTDIAMDLASGSKETAKSINSCVWKCLKKLEDRGFVHSYGDGYKASANGKKEFQPALDRALLSKQWNSLSDSKHFNL